MNESDQSKQRGQSLVLVAAAMVILVLFVAITVDVSNAYRHRRIAQNGADGAALAGARQLTRQKMRNSFSDTLIHEEMNNFAERNDIADTDEFLANNVNANVEGYYLDGDGNRLQDAGLDVRVGDGVVPEDALGIEAVTHIVAPTFFGGIFGLDGPQLQAEAAVTMIPTCGAECVVPIATYYRDFVPDIDEDGEPCYNIWNGQDPGNFGWLSWKLQGRPCKIQDCDAPCLRDNLDPDNECNSGWIEVGDLVAGSVGKMPAVFVEAHLRAYIDRPEKFTVIVWNETVPDLGGCNAAYLVAGFARMQLLGYQLPQGNGTVKYGHDGTGCVEVGWPAGEDPNNGTRLTAYFVEWVTGIGGGSCNVLGGTLRSPALTK